MYHFLAFHPDPEISKYAEEHKYSLFAEPLLAEDIWNDILSLLVLLPILITREGCVPPELFE